MRTPIVTFICALALGACRERQPPTANPSPPLGADETARVRQKLEHVKARIEQELSPPSGREPQRCPDELGLSRTRRVETLILRTRDRRAEMKTPLPLDFLATLSSDDFADITTHLTGGAEALWNPDVAKPHTPEDASLVLAALDALRERRYLAELRIEGFVEPKPFRSKGSGRSAWEPGFVAGRLVVYDLTERRALCQAPLSVRGDMNDLALRKGRRESTRTKLQQALSERVYASLETALASITTRLVLPARSQWNEPTLGIASR